MQTTQKQIKQKVDELYDLIKKHGEELKDKEYTGKRVSAFIAVGHHDQHGAGLDKEVKNELQAIVIGDPEGLHSVINHVAGQDPRLANLVHDAVCGIEPEHPIETMLKEFLNNKKQK